MLNIFNKPICVVLKISLLYNGEAELLVAGIASTSGNAVRQTCCFDVEVSLLRKSQLFSE